MEVEIALLAVAPNLRAKGEFRFLLCSHPGGLALPYSSLSAGNICGAVAADLLKKYTGIDANNGWVQLRQTGVFDNPSGDHITVTFGCVIPETTELRNDARWVSFADIKDDKALLERISQIVMKL